MAGEIPYTFQKDALTLGKPQKSIYKAELQLRIGQHLTMTPQMQQAIHGYSN